jgi:hypothetical protein
MQPSSSPPFLPWPRAGERGHRRVDHDDLAVKSLGNRRQQPIPDPGFAPSHEPVVACRIGTIAIRHTRPWRAGSEAPQDAVENLAVINTRHTANLVRQNAVGSRPIQSRSVRNDAFKPPKEALNQNSSQTKLSLGVCRLDRSPIGAVTPHLVRHHNQLADKILGDEIGLRAVEIG